MRPADLSPRQTSWETTAEVYYKEDEIIMLVEGVWMRGDLLIQRVHSPYNMRINI